MTSIDHVQSVNAPSGRMDTVGALSANGEAPGLLPDPDMKAMAATDPMSLLYLFESRDNQNDTQGAATKMHALEAERHTALEQEQKAIEQAVEASKHHGFWDDLGSVCGEVAKVAGVVASIAVAVGTCGAATPIAAVAIAGAVLSTAGFVDSEFHILQKFGVSADVAGWVDLGMSLGGAVASLGAGIAAGGATASSTTSTIAKAGAVVGGAAMIGKGASEIEAAQEQAKEDRAAADEIAAQAQSDHIGRLIKQLIDETKDSDEKSQRIMNTIAQTKTIQCDAALAAATPLRG
jgi:hypothetical protein